MFSSNEMFISVFSRTNSSIHLSASSLGNSLFISKDANYISKYENLTIYKQFDFEKDRSISLDDLFHKFQMCPNGITSENFKQALTEYENEFRKNPNINESSQIKNIKVVGE